MLKLLKLSLFVILGQLALVVSSYASGPSFAVASFTGFNALDQVARNAGGASNGNSFSSQATQGVGSSGNWSYWADVAYHDIDFGNFGPISGSSGVDAAFGIENALSPFVTVGVSFTHQDYDEIFADTRSKIVSPYVNLTFAPGYELIAIYGIGSVNQSQTNLSWDSAAYMLQLNVGDFAIGQAEVVPFLSYSHKSDEIFPMFEPSFAREMIGVDVDIPLEQWLLELRLGFSSLSVEINNIPQPLSDNNGLVASFGASKMMGTGVFSASLGFQESIGESNATSFSINYQRPF